MILKSSVFYFQYWVQSVSALSSQHHRVATVTHKLQKVHFPSKVGMVRFTDSYRYIRMNIYDVAASMTEVCIGLKIWMNARCIVNKISALIKTDTYLYLKWTNLEAGPSACFRSYHHSHHRPIQPEFRLTRVGSRGSKSTKLQAWNQSQSERK